MAARRPTTSVGRSKVPARTTQPTSHVAGVDARQRTSSAPLASTQSSTTIRPMRVKLKVPAKLPTSGTVKVVLKSQASVHLLSTDRQVNRFVMWMGVWSCCVRCNARIWWSFSGRLCRASRDSLLMYVYSHAVMYPFAGTAAPCRHPDRRTARYPVCRIVRLVKLGGTNCR